ncbi:MAG: hypothetical protein L6R35_004525 [Caloplaca aegaea]|nr:MAG: hypothetical protein L6R35_004525 [Caloplaca aegaea]
MKLFLIRHGETVDNVAHLAGVRDSALTVQGVLQAERLGQYLTASGNRFTHVFTSDLQRAVKTAQALLSAQPGQESPAPDLCQLAILREQDFGFYEGKPVYARQRNSTKSGKEDHRSQHQGDPGFQDVESKESMTRRTDIFVDQHVRPLILQGTPEQDTVMAVVSHGIILSHLWKSILRIFSKQTVSLATGLLVGGGGVTPLEYLGGWSNTGYLELDIMTFNSHAQTEAKVEAKNEAKVEVTGPPVAALSLFATEATELVALALPPTTKMLIKTVNGKEHLRGLKRARGVGSSQFDEGQKKIESFFKKTKAG